MSTAGAKHRRPAYRLLADRLRETILLSTDEDQRLPTEAELSKKYKRSRQTVRRAYQELVAEGLVRRIPHRGTFPIARRRYVRSFGTIEDLIAVREDTVLEVVEPLAASVDSPAHKTLAVGPTMELTIRRLYDGEPFACTLVSLPMEFGRLLTRTILARRGARRRTTVLEILESVTGARIAEARQVISVDRVPARLAKLIDVIAGETVMRIDRVYYDGAGKIVQMTTNYFNPRRYTYALDLRR
jgi:DNA-binding GntR family transcriptional regulator